MNSKTTTNSQLSTTEPKEKQRKQKLSKQLEQEQKSQKWRSHGGLSVGRRGVMGGKGSGNKKHNLQALNRWGEVKNGIGNRIQRTYMHNPRII